MHKKEKMQQDSRPKSESCCTRPVEIESVSLHWLQNKHIVHTHYLSHSNFSDNYKKCIFIEKSQSIW